MVPRIRRGRVPFWLAGVLALGQLPAQATTVNVRVTVLSPLHHQRRTPDRGGLWR